MTVPDTYALRRRVLLAGVLSLVLWLSLAWTIAWLEVSDAWLLIGTVLLYLLVTRPLMHPVREAIKLRRRLAYQAWLDEQGRDEQGKAAP
jgi:hypothetical protein